MGENRMGGVLRQIGKLIGTPSAGDWTDRQLLERFAQAHDESAFAMLVDRHGVLVLGVCRRILHNAHAAEDAFQATFLVLARKAGSLGWHESIGNWLYGVALRIALKARTAGNRLRAVEKQGYSMPASEESDCATWQAKDPTLEAVRHELHGVLDEELQQLPRKYRAPLVLCYLEGKTNDEAARELGRPTGSMSRHLARGRELLRKRLAHRGVVLSTGLLATLLGEKAARASVPPALAENAVQAAMLYTGGSAAGAGLISAEAVLLAEGTMKAMLIAKVKIAIGILILVGVTGFGSGTMLIRAGDKQAADKPAKGSGNPPAAVAAGASPGKGATAKAETSVPGDPPLVSHLRDSLAKPVTLEQGIDANTPLKDALEFISNRFAVSILVNGQAFKDDLASEEVEAMPVHLPKVSGVSLETVLKMLVAQCGGAYLVHHDHIEITTWKRAWPEEWTADSRQLAPKVSANFKQLPLALALYELGDKSGINVLLDAGGLEDAKQLVVTTRLDNAPIDTAVRLLADMADLKVVVIDNVLYVTIKAKAEPLEAEQAKRRLEKQAAQKEKKSAGQQTDTRKTEKAK